MFYSLREEVARVGATWRPELAFPAMTMTSVFTRNRCEDERRASVPAQSGYVECPDSMNRPVARSRRRYHVPSPLVLTSW